MADRYFIVLKHDGKVPAMAGCGKCKRKFFVPKNTYSRDEFGATKYLLRKFDNHSCGEPSESPASCAKRTGARSNRS